MTKLTGCCIVMALTLILWIENGGMRSKWRARTAMQHEDFIRACYRLAIRSGKKGNHTFGAVLVYDDEIVASAENTEVTGKGYGHAE